MSTLTSIIFLYYFRWGFDKRISSCGTLQHILVGTPPPRFQALDPSLFYTEKTVFIFILILSED